MLVSRSARSCPRPRPGWIRVWVERLPGGRPNKRGRESEIKGIEVCGFLCVCLRPCGSALEPPGTHRNAASLRCPGRPLFHKEVAARKKRGGGRNLLTLKQRLIYLIFYRRSQGDQDILGPLGFFGLCEGSEDETGFGECEGVRSTRR